MTELFEAVDVEILREKSRGGDLCAMTELAAVLIDQREDDLMAPEEALCWLAFAVDQGHAPAMVLKGIWLENQGEFNQAAICFMKGALAGDAEGASLLGGRYLTGRGIEKNTRQGLYWLNKAASQGESHAMMTLAVHYESGDELPLDIAKAIYWYERAAESGLLDAWQYLAHLFGDEQLPEFDYGRSLEYLKKTRRGMS